MEPPTIIQYSRQKRSSNTEFSPVKTKRYLEVCRRFMKQYAEISNLEKDYDIILTNPSVLNLQQKAHGLLELALSYEREGVKERSLSYYNQAMEKHNDLLLEAYKTVSLQYMIEVKKLLSMTPRSRLFLKAERLLEEAKESYLTAKNLRDELSMQSKVYYQLSIKSLVEIYNLLKI